MRRSTAPVRRSNPLEVGASALRPAVVAFAIAAGALAPRISRGQEPPAATPAADSVVGPVVPGLVVPSGGNGDGIARAASDTISLDDAIRTALSRSPAIREAEGTRLASRAAPWESWGRLVPSLSYSTGFNRADVTQRTATDPITGAIVTLPDSEVVAQKTFGTQAVISADWTVFDGGRTYWSIRRASAEEEAGELAYDAARARVAADVKIAYLNALEAVRLEDVRRADVERARALAEVAEARYRVGEVPELDDLQARLQIGDAEIALLEAESATDDARLRLFEHLGLSAQAEVALIEPQTPDLDDLPGEAELRERALEGSAELASLREARRAADRGLTEEKWWFLPSLSVGADWVRTEFGQDRDAFTFEPRNEQWFFGATLSWDALSQPTSLVSDRRRARAALYTAEGRLASREAGIAREVEVALGRLRRARVLEEQSRLNLDLARRQREQANERYRLGLAPITERLVAEALAAESERQAIVARYATLRALAELERAAGIRLTPVDAEAPPP